MECETEDMPQTDLAETQSIVPNQSLKDKEVVVSSSSETSSGGIEASETRNQSPLLIDKESTTFSENDIAEHIQDKMILTSNDCETNSNASGTNSVSSNGCPKNITDSSEMSESAVISESVHVSKVVKDTSDFILSEDSKQSGEASNFNVSLDNSDDLLSELESELHCTDERTLVESETHQDIENTPSSEKSIGSGKDSIKDIMLPIVGETISDSLLNIEDNSKKNGEQNTNTNILQTHSESSAKVESDSSVLALSGVNVETMAENPSSQGDKSPNLPNGVIPLNCADIPEFQELQSRYDTLQKLYIEKEVDIKRLREEAEKKSGELEKALEEKAESLQRVESLTQQAAHQQCEQKANQLEEQLSSQASELEETKAKLASQDVAARKHIQQLQADLQGKLSQVTRAFEECKRDKEGMVVKYAMAEQKNIELMDKMGRNEQWVKEIQREREQAIVKFKQMKGDKEKSEGAMLARGQEIVNMRREIEKQKELRGEVESKCKWANARLKQELENLKELKGKHEDLNKKYQHLVDAMKEKKQSQEVRQMTLAVQLDEKESALRQQQQEKTDQEEVHQRVKAELENLKRKHKEMIEEHRTYRDKVTCLEAERLHQEETLTKFKDTLQTQKREHAELCQRIGELEQAGQQLNKARDQIDKLKSHLSDLEESNRDLRGEMENCSKREGGHLEFTKKVSDKNARLQSENSALSNKLNSLQIEHEELQSRCTSLEEKISTLEASLEGENHQRIQENGLLRNKMDEKSRAVEELTQQLEDQKDENKTLKRRHQANIKDLSRQLTLAKRRLESGGNKPVNGERDSHSLGSMGSRTSSITSLNTMGGEPGGQGQESPQVVLPQEEEQPIVQFVEVDKQVLVDKIVKLQRQAARKTEKLEFMEEHISQLVEELQRKARIVQNYALREETGTLTPQETDLNKIIQARKHVQAQLSKKGGIMASVYSKHTQDDHMTMDLSLEINRKLQAVLEDTLLKNITLKENMDTLGAEIAKLSHSNRELQLDIHQLREQLDAKT